MPDPGRVPAVRRPGPAPAEGPRILGLHPAAETLVAALRLQVRTGRLIRAGQLSLESPCPGWSINLFDVLAHTWDIAAAAGVVVECPDELWSAGLEAARTVIGPGRDPRQYAPEVPVTAAA